MTADGGEGSPKAAFPSGGKTGGRGKSKAKAGAQAKGLVEDTGPKAEATVASVGGSNSGTGPAANPDALVAEATRLLKGVSLRAMSCDFEGDLTWIRSALASASNPEFCLVDSGATDALRPASLEELSTCRRIHVDLASGGTELMINECGTLLHNGPCQVILPANYLVQLGFSIVWKKRGCRIRHPKKGVLEVTVVKGCPLISREVGLALLREYEERRNGTPVLSKAEATDLQVAMTPSQARVWLRDRLALRGEGLTDVDQLVFMRGMFPGVPIGVLARVCVQALNESMVDWTDLPWNRRFRRSMSRASPGSALVGGLARLLAALLRSCILILILGRIQGCCLGLALRWGTLVEGAEPETGSVFSCEAVAMIEPSLQAVSSEGFQLKLLGSFPSFRLLFGHPHHELGLALLLVLHRWQPESDLAFVAAIVPFPGPRQFHLPQVASFFFITAKLVHLADNPLPFLKRPDLVCRLGLNQDTKLLFPLHPID